MAKKKDQFTEQSAAPEEAQVSADAAPEVRVETDEQAPAADSAPEADAAPDAGSGGDMEPNDNSADVPDAGEQSNDSPSTDAQEASETDVDADADDASTDNTAVEEDMPPKETPPSDLPPIPAVEPRQKTRYLPVLDSVSSGNVVGFLKVENEDDFVHGTRMFRDGNQLCNQLVDADGRSMGVLAIGVVHGKSSLVLETPKVEQLQALVLNENFSSCVLGAVGDYRLGVLVDLESI